MATGYDSAQHDDDAASPRGGGDYRNMSAQELEQQRQEMLVEQEQQLGRVHGGARVLKERAEAINDEVVEQNAIIDAVSEDMDTAGADLESGIENAEQVNKNKAKLCKMYTTVGLLAVIDIGLQFIPS